MNYEIFHVVAIVQAMYCVGACLVIVWHYRRLLVWEVRLLAASYTIVSLIFAYRTLAGALLDWVVFWLATIAFVIADIALSMLAVRIFR